MKRMVDIFILLLLLMMAITAETDNITCVSSNNTKSEYIYTYKDTNNDCTLQANTYFNQNLSLPIDFQDTAIYIRSSNQRYTPACRLLYQRFSRLFTTKSYLQQQLGKQILSFGISYATPAMASNRPCLYYIYALKHILV